MTYDEARKLLPVYTDGELDAAEAAEVERHLGESEELREELARWKSLGASLQRVVTGTAAPVGLKETVLASLASGGARTIRYRTLRWISGVTAAAAAIAVLFFVMQPRQVQAEPTEIAATPFMDIFRQCAVKHKHNGLKIDVSNFGKARAQLASLTSEATLVPDLRPQGFELGGACQCFQCEGVKAVHVFYVREEPTPAVVSVFSVDCKVRVKDCRCERCMCAAGICRNYEVVSDNGIAVFKWDEETDSYAICGNMRADELRHLADGVTLVRVDELMGVYVRADQ